MNDTSYNSTSTYFTRSVCLAFKRQGGFTLIETMVAVSIFAIVVTVGISALLALNASYKSSRTERAVVDGVSMAIERISREIKTGYEYTCDPGTFASIGPSNPDCAGASSFGFLATEAGTTKPTIYALNTITDQITIQTLEDGVDGPEIPITPEEVAITNMSFTLVNNSIGGDQPYVIIRIEGETYSDEAIPSRFSLQTTVSRRFPDVSVLPQ